MSNTSHQIQAAKPPPATAAPSFTAFLLGNFGPRPPSTMFARAVLASLQGPILHATVLSVHSIWVLATQHSQSLVVGCDVHTCNPFVIYDPNSKFKSWGSAVDHASCTETRCFQSYTKSSRQYAATALLQLPMQSSLHDQNLMSSQMFSMAYCLHLLGKHY